VALGQDRQNKRGEIMGKILAAAIALAFAPALQAADIEAGKAKVAEVCSACHGMNGVSVSDTIPNLAGQHASYLENQLNAYRTGMRKGPSPAHPAAIMNAMASQLSPADISNVAAYFASLAGAPAGTARSAQLPGVARTNLAFPDNYKATFVKYHTINFPATKQVRYYFANPAAADAAKAGKPLPDGSYLLAEVYAAKLDDKGSPVTGPDGFYVAGKPLLYTAMATGAGWGDAIPGELPLHAETALGGEVATSSGPSRCGRSAASSSTPTPSRSARRCGS
jgi:cytochrome c553